MSIEKLERVMWRIRKKYPNKTLISNKELRKCIMYEIGTSPQCYYQNRKALIKLGWIKTEKSYNIRITDKDITGDE